MAMSSSKRVLNLLLAVIVILSSVVLSACGSDCSANMHKYNGSCVCDYGYERSIGGSCQAVIVGDGDEEIFDVDDGDEEIAEDTFCVENEQVSCTSLDSRYEDGDAVCNENLDGWDREDCRFGATPGFVSITADTFWMGSPIGCPGPEGYTGDCAWELNRNRDYEELHEVTLTYDFEMSIYEITEAEFEDLIGWDPNHTYNKDCTFGCGDDHPVQYISWFDALAYANQLSLYTGLTPCYVLSFVGCHTGGPVGSDYMKCFGGGDDKTKHGILYADVTLADGATKPQDCEGYRLPTEAEWEYAIRVGKQYTAFYQSAGNDGRITDNLCSDPNMDQIGWYCGNTGSEGTPTYGTKPVGGKAANAWGLYDMSGNVYEWIWDGFEAAYQDDVSIDPTGPDPASGRAIRGGSFRSLAQHSRSASRGSAKPGSRESYGIGARLVRSSP